MSAVSVATKSKNLTVARILLLLVTLHYAFFSTGFISKTPTRSFVVKVAPTSGLTIYMKQEIVDASSSDNTKKKDKQKKSKKQDEYEYRKNEWLKKYGSLEALQATFGTGRKKLFGGGDLTPAQTRRLYHTLLPRSLLGLNEMGLMNPEELAPLAYEARIAAKEYARSRCVWYGRVMTALVDQYRSVRDKGTLRLWRKKGQPKSNSMTWEEIYSKYEAQIVQEECEAILQKESSKKEDDKDAPTATATTTEQLSEKTQQRLERLKDDKDLTMSIYLRILERSCVTNEAFDNMFLSETDAEKEQDVLNQMAQQLDQDVRDVLLGPKESEKVAKKVDKLQQKTLKEQEKETAKQEKERQKESERQVKEEQKRQEKLIKALTKAKKEKKEKIEKARKDDAEKIAEVTSNTIVLSANVTTSSSSVTCSTSKKPTTDWQVRRVLAGTRRKFRELRSK